ncbi:putative long-chain-fatty-acid--CoA ligase [Rosa chinensis]|uniref:Putative long-chain-fatty-acid--CoA ligase n=1 Tax=Rosa chinensis TaxID=74649 RepID=A0A2P6PQ19_ROSCH|nr:putative long-chain-fatty-acid--CoA ligase [Rosa chinensis]
MKRRELHFISLLNRVGLTESCGGCFTSLGNVHPMIGTVGAPLTTIEARLGSVPELGYDALSSVPCREIFLRGKNLVFWLPQLNVEINKLKLNEEKSARK